MFFHEEQKSPKKTHIFSYNLLNKWMRHTLFLPLGHKNIILNSCYGFPGKRRASLSTQCWEYESIEHFKKYSSFLKWTWLDPSEIPGLWPSPPSPLLQGSLRGHQFPACHPDRSIFQLYLNDNWLPYLLFRSQNCCISRKNDIQIIHYENLTKYTYF